MSANRFDTSQQQQYVSSYVPLPFQQLAALGEQAKTDFDEGKKLQSDLDALTATIKAAPSYEASRKAFVDSYNNKIRSAIDEAKGDYGSSEFKQKIRNLTTDFKNSTELQNFQKTLEAYNIWEKQKAQGNSKDLDYTYEMDPNNPNQFKQLDILKNPIYSSRFTKYEDWDEAAKKVVGHIAPTGGENIGDLLAKAELAGGTLYERHGSKTVGVTDNKLKGIVNQIIPNYASTSAGQHHLEKILQQDYNFGNSAFNVSYRDLNNQYLEAQVRISRNEGTEQDQKIVQMKNDIDSKFFNHIKAANQYQVGTVTDKSVQDQFIKNPTIPKSGDPNDPETQVLANLNLQSPLAQTFNANAQLKKVNPNTSFEFDENGKLKVNDGSGTKSVVNIKGPGGKTYKEGLNSDGSMVFKNKQEALAAGVNPALLSNVSDKIGYDSFGGNSIIVTTGGTVVQARSSTDYKINHTQVSNTDLRNQQMKEVLEYAQTHGLQKQGESGWDTYQKVLPIYEKILRASSGYKQVAVPMIQGENAKQFENYFLERDKSSDSEAVGRTGDWTLIGQGLENAKGTEAHSTIINNLKKNGKIVKFRPDLEGGDYFELEDQTGQHYLVKTNNKTVQAVNKPITEFVANNKKNLLNSNLDYSKVNKNLMDVANAWKVNPENFIGEYNSLIQNNMLPLSEYMNSQTGVYAISFYNPEYPEHVQVLQVRPDGQTRLFDESQFISKEFQLTSYQTLNNLVGKGSKGESETTVVTE